MVLIYFQLFSTFKTDKKASIWSQNLINFKFNLTVKIKKTTRTHGNPSILHQPLCSIQAEHPSNLRDHWDQNIHWIEPIRSRWSLKKSLGDQSGVWESVKTYSRHELQFTIPWIGTDSLTTAGASCCPRYNDSDSNQLHPIYQVGCIRARCQLLDSIDGICAK